MFMFHIIDGKVVATWRNADDLGRLFQFGARVVADEDTRQGDSHLPVSMSSYDSGSHSIGRGPASDRPLVLK